MFSNKTDPARPNHPISTSNGRTWTLKVQMTTLLFMAGVFASGCVIHDRGHGRGHYTGGLALQPSVAVAAPITFSFTDHHRHTVRDYYRQHNHRKNHKWKHKWKHKRNAHLHRGAHRQEAPYDLVRQLPPPPRNAKYIYEDDQILLIDTRTLVVLDLINIPEFNDPQVTVAVPAPITFRFNDNHRHTAQNYYSHHHHGKKHKWKKNKHKKHKKRWKHKRKAHLHPGARFQEVPYDLVRQLPPAPHGTRFIYDDDQVLLIDISTRAVVDFINISIDY